MHVRRGVCDVRLPGDLQTPVQPYLFPSRRAVPLSDRGHVPHGLPSAEDGGWGLELGPLIQVSCDTTAGPWDLVAGVPCRTRGVQFGTIPNFEQAIF